MTVEIVKRMPDRIVLDVEECFKTGVNKVVLVYGGEVIATLSRKFLSANALLNGKRESR